MRILVETDRIIFREYCLKFHISLAFLQNQAFLHGNWNGIWTHNSKPTTQFVNERSTAE